MYICLYLVIWEVYIIVILHNVMSLEFVLESARVEFRGCCKKTTGF